MKFDPVVPAALSFDSSGLPFSPAYHDVYHPAVGAAVQAEHVFLAGNDLPQRWRGRADFVILETGFGLGNNFLATWHAWRQDPQRCERLHFISVEQHPFVGADLARAHAASPWPELAAALIDAWPPLTPDLHPLSFDAGRVRLRLALGDIQAWLPQIVASVDAFYLDGFAPARNAAMWAPRICKALARLAGRQATLATWSAARSVRDGLRSAGFEVRAASGIGGKRDITLARFEPTFRPRRAPARASAPAGDPRHAVIVGAGLAGCAAAWALAQLGWTSVVLEQHAAAAVEASGNPAGTFHGIVNRQDGAHARFNRAAALEAQRVIAHAVRHRAVPGDANGLIRLESELADVAVMRAVLAELGLPENYVRAIAAREAAELSGLPLTQPAWFYPGGGWVDPAALARCLLALAGPRATLRCGVKVESIRRAATGWETRDATGRLIEPAAILVLANAGGALALLNRSDWPMQCQRGQVSLLPIQALPAAGPRPRLAVAGSGFLIPAVHGHYTFGATSRTGSNATKVSALDHSENLARLQAMCDLGWSPHSSALKGRVGWRCSSSDRLPVIGAVPCAGQTGRLDQPRFATREPGLHVFIGLGSRGITWSTLGAQVLAALMSGTPVPLGAALIDAIDPARFASRRFRQAQRAADPAGH